MPPGIAFAHESVNVPAIPGHRSLGGGARGAAAKPVRVARFAANRWTTLRTVATAIALLVAIVGALSSAFRSRASPTRIASVARGAADRRATTPAADRPCVIGHRFARVIVLGRGPRDRAGRRGYARFPASVASCTRVDGRSRSDPACPAAAHKEARVHAGAWRLGADPGEGSTEPGAGGATGAFSWLPDPAIAAAAIHEVAPRTTRAAWPRHVDTGNIVRSPKSRDRVRAGRRARSSLARGTATRRSHRGPSGVQRSIQSACSARWPDPTSNPFT